MSSAEQLAIAERQLDRILGFFPRVDAKASAVFAINAALITILCLNITASDVAIWYVALPGSVSLAVLLVSQFFLYRCAFPSLKGGRSSLIYFREVANKTEAKYIAEFSSTECEELITDVLGQVWRNSEILKMKFDALKVAFVLTGVALIPWTVYLIATAVLHGQAPALR